MSDEKVREVVHDDPPKNEAADTEDGRGGINLWLVYGLMFLALLVAIGLATLIVLPFYQRR
ncbi:MAG TPA: hypothetical protein VGJ21_08465 [Terracidiphilus sp.]|jgi:hypothetical protein